MTTKVYIPQWKLRRFAPRAVRVLARHKGKAPALGHFEPTLVPAANKFIALYDTARTAEISVTQQSQALRAVEVLRSAIRVWLGALSRDIPGFDIASYTDRQQVADDVIGSGERLLEVCRNFHDPSGAPLAYKETMEQALGVAITAAANEWADAQSRRVALQAMREETRLAAVALQKELVAFRRTLREELGTSHLDYQSLRANMGVLAAEEVEEEVEETVGTETEAQPSISVALPATSSASNNSLQQEVSAA